MSGSIFLRSTHRPVVDVVVRQSSLLINDQYLLPEVYTVKRPPELFRPANEIGQLGGQDDPALSRTFQT
jgi:hypothetical protein